MTVFAKVFRSLCLAVTGITIYLYYYTALCNWKWKAPSTRILFLADPQLEGDAKLARQGKIGELDLAFNDYYFRHVYTSFVSPFSLFGPPPTHVVLLGDLFSSQWIDDVEFEKRVERFKWIFGDNNYNHHLVNLSGNHDIGYGRDMTPSPPEHIFAVINSQNVDGPAWDEALRSETWAFLNELAAERERDNYKTPLVLLTHIPLHKEAGLCVDEPLVLYDEFNHIIEQNHFTSNATDFILTKLRPRFIFAGHDHRGCDVTYDVTWSKEEDKGEPTVKAYRTRDYRKSERDDDQGDSLSAREVTLRSVMAEFGGNAGLFEIRYRNGAFQYAYQNCPFVTNHIPWIIMILDAILILVWIFTRVFLSAWNKMLVEGVPAQQPLVKD
ncbi:1925_t:CDS:2 [Paraglomus occultum]|uniref:1925_t:CDS:1 n=1 Tax=Paraglomus occultum TaxID=144539 RepID=A0A9N9AH29_9GLOM|nr:1925_t:CDS:2 [Paraglomus occultum]